MPKYMGVIERNGKVTDLSLFSSYYDAKTYEWEHRKDGDPPEFYKLPEDPLQERVKEKELIKNRALGKKPTPTPVVCMETGEIYRCVKDLHKRLIGMSRWTLDLRLKNNMAIDGKHYALMLNDDKKNKDDDDE